MTSSAGFISLIAKKARLKGFPVPFVIMTKKQIVIPIFLERINVTFV
jgi:hypothetical protein